MDVTYLDVTIQVGHFMIYECHGIGETDSCGTMLNWIARNFLASISGRMLLCWVRFWCLDSLVLPCIFDISIFHTWPLTWSTILGYLLGEMLLVLSHGEKKLYISGILVFFFLVIKYSYFFLWLIVDALYCSTERSLLLLVFQLLISTSISSIQKKKLLISTGILKKKLFFRIKNGLWCRTYWLHAMW